jgi:hypothetical protein
MYCSLRHPTSAILSKPLLNSYSEKIKPFIIFDEIPQLAAGMTYIHVQLSLNITAIYYENEIIKANLKRITYTEFKSNFLQAFTKAIKTKAEFFSV